MAELADALALGASVTDVQVQVLSPAPIKSAVLYGGFASLKGGYMVTVNFVKLDDKAIVPTYGTQFAAGADLYALPCCDEPIKINPNETVLIHTGIAMQIPNGYAGMIFARSGIATKRGLAPANKVGVIDSDYRGEIMVSIHNHSENVQEIAPGERIAQLVIMPYVTADFVQSESLEETERAAGGFGSTGTK